MEISDTVTVSRIEWEEMKKTMQDAVDRLAVCERPLKRAAPNEYGETPAKRVRAPTIVDRYLEQPRLVNPSHFHNCWAHSKAQSLKRIREHGSSPRVPE